MAYAHMNKSCPVLPEISDMWKDADIVRGENSASDEVPRSDSGEQEGAGNSISSGYMFLAGAAAVAATAMIIVKRSG